MAHNEYKMGNNPKMKPYPKYKPSGIEWIGEIPEHWINCRLKAVIDRTINGVWGEEEKFDENDFICVRVADYDMNKLGVSSKNLTVRNIQPNQQNGRILNKRDLLIEKSGGGELSPVGRVIRFDIEEKAVCSNFIGKMAVNTHISDSNFLVYLFFALYSNKLNTKNIKQTTGIQNLDLDGYLNERFYLPKLYEQTAIANYLDRKTAQIDDLIAKKQRLIELLNEEKTALINQAVTKGLNPDAPLKDSDIPWLGKIPAHWEVIRLKWIADINPSKGSSSFDKNSNELVTFLPMEKVSEDNSFDNSLKKPICELWSGFTYFEEGDVIVAKITPCFENGKGALLEKLGSNIGFGSTEFHVLRASQNVQRKFLFYLTRTELFKNMGEALMYGAAGQKRVPTSYLEEYVMALPPIEEQDLIVHHIEANLSRITDTISKIQREIDLLQEYRTALISEAVTGKIDVRDEAIEWQKI